MSEPILIITCMLVTLIAIRLVYKKGWMEP